MVIASPAWITCLHRGQIEAEIRKICDSFEVPQDHEHLKRLRFDWVFQQDHTCSIGTNSIKLRVTLQPNLIADLETSMHSFIGICRELDKAAVRQNPPKSEFEIFEVER
jgi:hypothetical protein